MTTAAPSTLTVEQLQAELDGIQAALDAAYWTFTRTARGVPPAVACPGAYERRAALREELRRRRRAIGPSCVELSQ